MTDIVQFKLILEDRMYGGKRLNDEIAPYLPAEVRHVDIIAEGMGGRALETVAQWALNKGDLNHFTDPNLAFMGFFPGAGDNMISLYDAIGKAYYGNDRLHYKINFLGYRKFGGVMTISNTAARDISRWYGVDPRRIHVVPCGVNTQDFHEVPEAERQEKRRTLLEAYKVPEDAICLLYVGNPWPHKNVEYLITLLDSDPRYHLFHTGYDQQAHHKAHYDDMRKRAGHIGVSDRYHLLGFVEDLPSLYHAVDVVVSASMDEGFNLPPLEGAACGTPSVLSDIPIHNEIYRDYCLLAGDTYTSWKKAISMVMQDPDFFRSLGRDLVKKYSWENAAKALMQAYREMGV